MAEIIQDYLTGGRLIGVNAFLVGIWKFRLKADKKSIDKFDAGSYYKYKGIRI